MHKQTAIFSAGCFWGVEKLFMQVPGVISTRVGYTGGHTVNPSYEQVCHGNTGHAESIKIEFDADAITYQQLLEIFWHMHNPTTLNRQGPDIGTQYRSAIFCGDQEQLDQALASKASLEQEHAFKDPITTEITMASPFYEAEEYHQQYLLKNGGDHC